MSTKLVAKAEKFQLVKFRSAVGRRGDGACMVLMADSGITVGPAFAKKKDAQKFADYFDIVASYVSVSGGEEMLKKFLYLIAASGQSQS